MIAVHPAHGPDERQPWEGFMTKPNSIRHRYQTKRPTRILTRWKRETLRTIDAMATMNGVSRHKQILALLATQLGS